MLSFIRVAIVLVSLHSNRNPNEDSALIGLCTIVAAFLVVDFLEARFCYGAQAESELSVLLLPHPPEGWNRRSVPPHSAAFCLFPFMRLVFKCGPYLQQTGTKSNRKRGLCQGF